MNQYTFSGQTMKMKSSKIRELMKYSSMPGVISFGGGSPASDFFPINEVKHIIQSWSEPLMQTALQYGSTAGYFPLIDAIAQRMQEVKQIDTNTQDILVTTGGQQGLYLLSRIFIDSGDVVLVEEPTFIGAMASFMSCSANLQNVAIDEEGVNLEALEKKLALIKAEGKKVSFLYVIPNFQNPSGATMSQKRRKELYDFSKKHNLVLVEDDPYGDLFYEGEREDYLPIKSFGNDAPIVYVGSFSKVLSPGFRLGWLLADPVVIEKAALSKQSVDACSTTFGQVIACDYLNQNKINGYLETMRRVYKEKRDFMIDCIEKYFPSQIEYTKPKGGFFVFIKLPQGISAQKLFEKTIQEKVAFVTGDPFIIDPTEGDSYVRLSFSNSTENQIKQGIQIIGKSIYELMTLG